MNSIHSFYTWLDGFINFEKTPHKKAFSLDVIRHYAALFSNPQNACKCIHIAGSKGKGSVAAMLSALLSEVGYKTGLYTSPHVNDFRERITENGHFFSDAAYLEAFRTLKQGITQYGTGQNAPRPSWFELVTLAAFILFKQQHLDWAVFETGMGGRLDATNIVQPELTILTPIELEHCEYLGSTIALIAGEKAGIIKAGVPVFCSRQQEAALCVFKERSAAAHAPFFYLPDFLASADYQLTGSGSEITLTFSCTHPVGALFTRPIHTVLQLFTPVQAENAALAAAAFKFRFPDIPETIIERALAQAWLPARFQILSTNPLIVLDGAHTHNSIQTCIETFIALLEKATAQKDKKPALLFACAADKKPQDSAPLFCGKVSKLYLTIPGAFKKGNLKKTVAAFTSVFSNEQQIPIDASEDFTMIITKALTQSYAENLPLLITGSFYLAAEAQRIHACADFQGREKKG